MADARILLLDTAQLPSGISQQSDRVSRERKVLLFVLLASATGFLGWCLTKSTHKTSFNPLNGKQSQTLIDRVSPKLRRQLLRLINDPKTANRLLMGIYQHHRDRSPDWIAEKVIYDLRRGR